MINNQISSSYTIQSTFSNKVNIDNFYLLSIFFMSVLPYTANWYVLRMVYLGFIFVYMSTKKVIKIPRNTLVILVIWLIDLLANSLFLNSGKNLDWQLHEFQRFLMYSVLILLSSNIKIQINQIRRYSILLLLFHLLIQLAQWFRFEVINDFIRFVYSGSEETGIHLSLVYEKGIANFRSGSIFLNPNVYLVYPLIFCVVFFQCYLLSRKKTDFLFILLSMVSILLTGSRTGFVVVSVITFIYF